MKNYDLAFTSYIMETMCIHVTPFSKVVHLEILHCDPRVGMSMDRMKTRFYVVACCDMIDVVMYFFFIFLAYVHLGYVGTMSGLTTILSSCCN